MPTKKEREELLKAIGKINNRFELIAFIFAFRQRELFQLISLIEFILITVLITKYTDLFEIIFVWIKGFII